MDDLLREFLTETSESITVLDVELIKLEQQPDNPELLGVIFRVVHTIKGTCGFLGLPRLEAVAHAAEEVLGKFRAGELTVTQDAVTLILESLDCIKGLLSALEQTEAEPAGDDKELIGRLDAFAKGGDAPSPAEEAACRPQAVADEPIPADLATQGEAEAAATETSDAVPALASPGPAPADVEQPAAQSAGQPAVESAIASHTIRVGVDLLEHLM
ncbi:MAG: Hpt domain-containing protein, partial [Alphaproteobacteria bacterium]